MFSKLLVVIGVAVVAAKAQGINNIPPCILACAQAVGAVDNCTITDPGCACSNLQYQNDTGACLQQNCPDQIPAALALQATLCTNSLTTITPTGPVPTTINNVTITLTSSSGSATPTNGTSSTGTTTGTSTGTGITRSIASATSSGPTSSSESSGSSSAAAESSTPSSGAISLVSNSGVAAVLAMIAGILAI